MSIAALVLAVPGAVIAAIPLAIAGLSRTRNRARRGRALAIAGLTVSWVWTLVFAMAVGAAAVWVGQDRALPDAESAANAGRPLVTPSPSPSASGPSSAPPGSAGEPNVRPRKVRISKLRTGQCVDREPSGQTFDTLPVVPCAQPHSLEIYAIRDLPAGRWPGDDAVNDLADGVCAAAFEKYVGVGYDESALEITWYTPTAGAWRSGDRGTLCILGDPAGRLVGTMKGSRR